MEGTWKSTIHRRNLMYLSPNPFFLGVSRMLTIGQEVSVRVVVVVYLTLTDPLRIQPWSQDRRNQTKSNRESEISRESRQKRTDKRKASKGHRRDKIENKNKNTQTVEKNRIKRREGSPISDGIQPRHEAKTRARATDATHSEIKTQM